MSSQSPALRVEKPLRFVLALVASAIACAGFAVSAPALETLGPGAEAAGECPALTAVKYPWIECQPNAFGGVALSIPGQPAPNPCNLVLPDGSCAAGPREWGLVPQIPPSRQ